MQGLCHHLHGHPRRQAFTGMVAGTVTVSLSTPLATTPTVAIHAYKCICKPPEEGTQCAFQAACGVCTAVEKFKVSPNNICGNPGWESQEVELKKPVHHHEGHSIPSLECSFALCYSPGHNPQIFPMSPNNAVNKIWDAVSKASDFFLMPIARWCGDALTKTRSTDRYEVWITPEHKYQK